MDLEGIDLSRNGEICLIQLAVKGDPDVKLIDVTHLGTRCVWSRHAGSLARGQICP